MIPIELIGTGVASIATILGGVWFILNKTFGAAKMVHRIEELDTRTRGASCTHHSNVITDLRDEIKEMHTDVVTIKVILATTNKEAAAIFSIKNSPRELNSSGKRLLADVDGMSFLRKYKDVLFADMDTYTPKTALDVEAASFGTCMSCEYNYSEGAMAFPDYLDRASRTIITGEGGAGPSRFKHVIKAPSGRYRRLIPIELERLNMFPDNHTLGSSNLRRAFLMGNALVTGIVENIALVLKDRM